MLPTAPRLVVSTPPTMSHVDSTNQEEYAHSFYVYAIELMPYFHVHISTERKPGLN